MKSGAFLLLLCIMTCKSYSQIEAVYFLPKGDDKFNIGFGAALKFGIPVSEAARATVEAGVVYAAISGSDNSQGIALVPVKLGYRYTLNGTGSGFFVEPQAGYCVYGAFTNDVVDRKINGFQWSVGTGFLFQPGRSTQYEIGLRYETIHFKDGGPLSFIGLRLSSNFSFRSRDID